MTSDPLPALISRVLARVGIGDTGTMPLVLVSLAFLTEHGVLALIWV